MTWIDAVIIALILVSTAVGIWRGFVRETLSLLAWIVSFWLAIVAAPHVAPYLSSVTDSETARAVLAFVLVFVAALFVAGLVNHLVVSLVRTAGLGGADRVVGMLFGLARGVAVVAAVMVVGLVAGADAEPWWRESRALGALMPIAAWMHGFLPPDIGTQV
jgi:membrane protein required for colicin V production